MADEVVGSAYVVIRAITNRIKDDIREGVKRGATASRSDLESAGETIGETVGTAAGETAGEQITENIERTSRRHRGRHRAIGTGIGRSITGGLSRGMRRSSSLIGRALTSGGKLLDTARDIGSNIGKNISQGLKGAMPSLGSLGLVAILSIIPLITSGLSALTGSVTAFIGSAAQASYVTFAFAGILGTLKQVTGVAKIAMGGLSEAIAGTDGAMEKLAPSAQAVARAVKSITPEWTAMKKAVQGAVFAGVAPLLEKMAETTLPVLQKGLVETGGIMNRLIKSFAGWTTSAGFVEKFGIALKGNNDIFRQLKRGAVPLLRGLLNLYIALQPAAEKLAGSIKRGAQSFRGWSTGEGLAKRLTGMFDRGWKAATRLWKITKNLGGVLKNVFGAAVKPGDNLLKTLVKLSKRLKNFTELDSSKNAIAEWAQKGIDVSGKLFKALGRGFKVIKPLFNPDILGGFLTAFEKIMPVVTTIVGVFQDALAPILEKVGDAFEENGPKFAALFEALGPLLAGIGSVIGEVISQALDMLGTIAAVITPVVGAISNFIGPILTRFAPIIAAIILAFTTWGGTLVKLIPVIGKFLAPLVKLASWLIKKIAPAVKFLGKVVFTSFKLIYSIIRSTTGFIFKIIGKVFGFIGKFVPSTVRSMVTDVTGAFSRMGSRIATAVSGIWTRITNTFDRVVKFLGKLPGRFTTAVAGLWNGLQDGFKSVINWIIDKWNNLSFSIPAIDLGPLGKFGGGDINFPDIPRLATGGRATRGTLAVIGEGKEAETVLPDSLLKGLVGDANATGRNQGAKVVNITNNIHNPEPERSGKSVGHVLRDAAYNSGWSA